MLTLTACAGGTAVEDVASQQQGPPVQSMQLLTPTQGWALTDEGLKWTSDGGLAWVDITPPAVSAAVIKGLFFLDAQRGWTIVPSNVDDRHMEELLVYRTDDGGKTWQSSPLGAPDGESHGAPAYIHFSDAEHGWVVVKLVSSSNFSIGDLFRTTDGGVTWTKLSIPIGNPVVFTSPSDGWTAGGPAGDKLYVTRDGGASWEPQAVSPPPGFRSSYPAYELPVFTAAREGVLPVTFTGPASGIAFYVTHDGGRSWTLEGSVVSPQTLSLGLPIPSDVVDFNTWVAVSPDGARVFTTADGGKNIQQIAPNGLQAGAVDVDFSTAEIGWALSSSGVCPPGLKTGCVILSQLLKTTDGGQTWTVLIPQ